MTLDAFDDITPIAIPVVALSSFAVRLSPSAVEIVDDGVGRANLAGNGLSGLRERVAAAGGVVDAGPLRSKGWRLRVSLAPAGSDQ